MNGVVELAHKRIAPEVMDRDRVLALTARHDKEAFSELYSAYYPRIYHFILKRIGNIPDCEDATARTFEKALRCIGKFDAEKGSFSAWLFRIAINVTNDHLRDRKANSAVSFDDLEQSYSFAGNDNTEPAVELADVLLVIRKLNRTSQVVLALRYLEGFEYDEISEILGCTRKALSKRVGRALRAFEKEAREAGILPATEV